MRIKDILFQALAPRFKGVLWAKPEGDAVKLLINHNGEWKELAGGSGSGTSGSSTGCDCAYQVVIKLDNDGNPTLMKGDFNTAYNKLIVGEYVDVAAYTLKIKSSGVVTIQSELLKNIACGERNDMKVIELIFKDRPRYYWTESELAIEDQGTADY